jgi:hypothetical protein
VVSDVFVSGKDGFDTYRIPAIEAAADGSLIAFAEARKYNASDPGWTNQEIDLVYKRSVDQGAGWSAMTVLDHAGQFWSAANPATLLDRTNGRLWVFYICARPGCSTETARPGTDDLQTLARWSGDNGRSWSERVDLTGIARDLADTAWRASVPGPGGAIQTRTGRLLVPMWKMPYANFVIYSDDHGRAWKRGQCVPGTLAGDECQVAELSDGRILMDIRQQRGANRWLAESRDGGITWDQPRPGVAVTPVACALERLALPSPPGERCCLLWTGPTGAERKRLRLLTSDDDGRTFARERLISDQYAAYSDLAVLPGGGVGVLWEHGVERGYQFISFTRLSREWLAEAPGDAYGGWPELQGNRTGFFHSEQIQGRWWLVSPEGNAFFSKGVDHVAFTPESDASPKAPDDPAAWAKAAGEQLRGWNFNTLGAWSAPQTYAAGLAYAPMVDVAASAGRDVWLKGGIVDYFSPEFQQAAERAAQRVCAPRAKDPWVLGYFTDNELRWGADWRGTNSLLEQYLKMPAAAAGCQKAAEFLKARGHGPDSLSAEDKSEFLGLVAAEYARVASEAIRRADPNHLVLGCRFALYPGDSAIRAVGRYFDVISYHSYNSLPPVDRLEQITRLTGKPVLLSEFSFKAMDSGLPNTKGAARPVATQEDRAAGFARYVEALAALPGCVGYHWFQYRDQPKEGRRLDGENNNYGVVKSDGTPWETLTSRMKEVNAGIEGLHAKAQAR